MTSELTNSWIFKKNQIYLVDFGEVIGAEQGGIRPAIILGNNFRNYASKTIIVAPLTTKIKKNKMFEHIIIKPYTGLSKESMVLIEQIRTIDKERCIKYIGFITLHDENKIKKALSKTLVLKTEKKGIF